MKSSLKRKYIFVGTGLILGFLVLLMVTSRLLKQPLVEQWSRKEMKAIAAQTEKALDDAGWNMEKEDIDDIAFRNNVSITVTDEEFQILVSTRVWESKRGTFTPKTLKVLESKKEELDKNGSVFFSHFENDAKVSFAQMTKVEDRGCIIIRKALYGLNSSMRVMEICFFIAAGIVLVVGILAIIVLSSRMVRPICKIDQVTRQIAQLNFDEKAPVTGNDELGALAESVNIMSDKLKNTMESLQKDIELREALVRNMAHELKTPTAVIMGYAENMPEIAIDHPEKLEKYCTVISNECERMSSMIQQMLDVSAGEQGGLEIHPTPFASEKLLEAIGLRYEDEFRERKGIFQTENRITSVVNADFAMLSQAVYNFVRNAVRYGKKDGKISVRAWETQDFFYFSVYNEGEPIPKEEQEKIWNVFYKINPARTREKESFGIGLSIVKQAALAHGGEAGVNNVAEGVEFWLTVKRTKDETEEKTNG